MNHVTDCSAASQVERKRRRITFDGIAEVYDSARPSYPCELVDRMLGEAGLQQGAPVLEVGCGTGQMTRLLAGRGLNIHALELGPEMARLAMQRMADLNNVVVENADFEQWVPAMRFDAVVSATAFHWIDPVRSHDLVAQCLRPGGMLAVVSTEHVAGGTEQFFADFNTVMADMGLLSSGSALPQARDVVWNDYVFDCKEDFEAPRSWLFEWDEAYTADQYVALIRTYSDHRILPGPAALSLERATHALIVDRYNGSVAKRYCNELRLYRYRG